MPTTSKAFDAAAEISRNDKSGKTSTEDMLRGYGLYKVVMTGVGVCPLHTTRTATSHDAPPCLAGPDKNDCPSVMNVMAVEKRQKWFAYEAAWAECGGDTEKAQQLYVTHTEQCQGLEPGSLSK